MTRLLKTATAALVLGLMTTTPAVAQKLSPAVIVVVDMDQVIGESAAGKAASTEIQTKVNTLRTRANTLQTQLQTDAEQIQKGQADKTLAGAALESRAKAFGEKQQQAQQEIGRLENDVQRTRAFVVQQITDAANPIITTVMRERGASIALQEGATLQHSASIDITNDVISRLNTSTPRVSTKPPAQTTQPAQN